LTKIIEEMIRKYIYDLGLHKGFEKTPKKIGLYHIKNFWAGDMA
jgi:hypothetical protein